MSGPEERQRAVDLCSATPMTTAQVVEPPGPSDQAVPGTLAGKGSRVCRPYGETHHPAGDEDQGDRTGAGRHAAEAGRRTARRGPRSGPQPGQGVSRGRYSRVAARKQERRPGRQASDVTGSGRRRRRGPAPAGRGAGTGERVDAGGGGGVRLFQGKVRVPQGQGRAPNPRLGEGAPQDHGRGWSDGACSRTTRVRLMRGRGHAGSRQPRRPRFHG